MLSFTSTIWQIKLPSELVNQEMQFYAPTALLCIQTTPIQFIAYTLCSTARTFAVCAIPFASFATAFVYPATKQICLAMKQIYSATTNNKHTMALSSPVTRLFDFAMRQRITVMRQVDLVISQINLITMENSMRMIQCSVGIKNFFHKKNKFLFLYG